MYSVGFTPSVRLYLVMIALWPMIFFTMAGNIVPTYVLTALPAFALLAAVWLRPTSLRLAAIAVAMVLPLVMLLAHPLGVIDRLEARSHANSISMVKRLDPDASIAYIGRLPHSARFYSLGKASQYGSEEEFLKKRALVGAWFVFVQDTVTTNQMDLQAERLPDGDTKRFRTYIFPKLPASQ